jgi:hypothetical protein
MAGILSSSLLSSNSQGIHDRRQQFRQDFQKLGQDLQSGNLTGAQADFAALQKDGLQSSSSTQNSNPIAQELQQLSTDLQSGNLTAAQQDYSNLQQDFQNQAAQRPHHHHYSSWEPGQQRDLPVVLADWPGSAVRRSNLGTTGIHHTPARLAAVRPVARRAQRCGEQRRPRNGIILVSTITGASGLRFRSRSFLPALWLAVTPDQPKHSLALDLKFHYARF